MNQDIRISVGFFQHHKTKKLIYKLDYKGVVALLSLWTYAAQNKPKGILTNMDKIDIALSACWIDDADLFVDTLVDIGFLEDNEGMYTIHDWEKNNPYVFHAEERSEKARTAAQAKWGVGDEVIPKTRSGRMKLARSKGNHNETEWKEMVSFFDTCVKCDGIYGLTHYDRDHIKPVYQGGCNSIRNIQPLCAKCNASKGAESIDYRETHCIKKGKIMPDKWKQSACSNIECCMHDACTMHARMPAPSPVPSPDPLPYLTIEQYWNQLCKASRLTKIKEWSADRKRLLKARSKDEWFVENWQLILDAVHKSNWCRENRIGIEHALRPKNALRYYEGLEIPISSKALVSKERVISESEREGVISVMQRRGYPPSGYTDEFIAECQAVIDAV